MVDICIHINMIIPVAANVSILVQQGLVQKAILFPCENWVNYFISEQQVTLYPHRDDNNWWSIKKTGGKNTTNIEYIKNGDIVTLVHATSPKRLHSHDHRPPMTDLEYHNEVR
jgi:dolichyl-phosphate-mannose--protein O-mannosyl transferase